MQSLMTNDSAVWAVHLQAPPGHEIIIHIQGRAAYLCAIIPESDKNWLKKRKYKILPIKSPLLV